MRLIDADALKEVFIQTLENIKSNTRMTGQEMHIITAIHTVGQMIDDMPTIDAVPVIRCRDCKFLRFTGTVWKCQNRLVMMLCEPNDYCSRGERKEE